MNWVSQFKTQSSNKYPSKKVEIGYISLYAAVELLTPVAALKSLRYRMIKNTH
jgi:hypothetical protein